MNEISSKEYSITILDEQLFKACENAKRTRMKVRHNI